MPEYETQRFDEVADALKDVLAQFEAQGWNDLVWRGVDKLHHTIAATSSSPSEAFSNAGRDHAEDQGRSFMDVFIMVTFQLGFHNGVLRESKETEFWKGMYNRTQTR